MPGKRLARSVLPVPGGPQSKRLWPPAAAISSARRAPSWPATSDKYQKGDLGAADGSGVQGRIAYNMGNGFSIGTNLSYDDAFDGRVSADILYRFASPKATTAPIKKGLNAPTIKGLTDGVKERDVRVHDAVNPCLASTKAFEECRKEYAFASG